MLGRLNLEVVNKHEVVSLRARYGEQISTGAAPPPDIIAQLRSDNPRLVEFRERYRMLDLPMTTHSKWVDEMVSSDIDLRNFRADNAYVYQQRDLNAEVNHVLTAHHLMSIDRLGLFERLTEDGMFGVCAYWFDGDRLISRDLLDSIAEITFLDEALGLSGRDRFRILDIGAGYGRLAHRLATAFPETAEVFCVDAVAESTFLSELYLRFQGVDDRAHVVPLDEADKVLADQPIDLVTNIHSFSECTLTAVRGWLDLVRANEVPHLLIIPNAADTGGTGLATHEPDNSQIDYRPEIEARGYRLKLTRPKYTSPSVQRHGVSPTHYFLFELG